MGSNRHNWPLWTKTDSGKVQSRRSVVEGNMIEKIIEKSAANKFLVFLVVLFISAWGIWAFRSTPLDALPALSDVQLIVYTTWMGRIPSIVEDQVSYRIASTMLAAPKRKLVRGFSDFG